MGPPGVVAGRCHRASGGLARAVGLLGTHDLAGDEALWIEPCGSIHTIGMRIDIGAAFLDAEGAVLRVIARLVPGRIAVCRGARAVVEARPEVLAGLRAGDRLSLERDPSSRG